ncbi:MAG: thioredoxin family protein [Acidimicrobiia bacterium]
MHVKILGPGCKNCQNLEARTREALGDLGVAADIAEVTDYGEIAGYGVMKTPGLVVDDVVVVSGRVPTVSELRDLLRERRNTR